MDDILRALGALQNVSTLDTENYGYWKVNMKAIIQGIDEDAWTIVEEGYQVPQVEERDGSIVMKPKNKWTKQEKTMSRYNAKALSTIFTSVSKNQHKMIQGSTTAKEAWDRLEMMFEGTARVKTSRIDRLASQFENLRMDEHETITEFSAKLCSISNEAKVMGKTYTDKKLVKKLLRSLSNRFEAKKVAIEVSFNTDEISFDEIVGMLQVYEMELKDKEVVVKNSSKVTLPVSDENLRLQQLEETIGSLVKRFDKLLEEVERKPKDSFVNEHGRDKETRGRRSEFQCHECQGFGHIRPGCPNIKQKAKNQCSGCKGYGHTKVECVNVMMRKEHVHKGWNSEVGAEEELSNVMALTTFMNHEERSEKSDSDFVAGTDKDCSSTSSESESDQDVDFQAKFKSMYEDWLKTRNEKLIMAEDRLSLKKKGAETRR